MSAQSHSSLRTRLAALGRRLFGHRLFVGLLIAVPGLEILSPTPLFAPKYRLSHLLAACLIVAGFAMRAWASGSAGRHTRTAQIEAPRLVTEGPYAYLRNPIYAGTMTLGYGMAWLIGDPWAFVLATVAFAILYFAIIPAEEEYLNRQFGEDYRRYCAEVPRLIPRWRPWSGRVQREFHWRAACGELTLVFLTMGIYAALLAEEWLDKVWG